MKVIESKPIPIYLVTCPECGSKIEYQASEVSFSHITCPVCGVCMWADTVFPFRFADSDNEKSLFCSSGAKMKVEDDTVD